MRIRRRVRRLRSAEETLKELGMEGHQALIVSHRDGQPHVHVIANRVDPESGKAEGLSRSKLKLSRWAEKYEREQGKIRCPKREINNMRRSVGARVVDGRGHTGGRWRRDRMNPEEERKVIPAGQNREEQEQVVWWRAEERTHWERFQQRRAKALGGELEERTKREWSALYGRQERERERQGKDCRGVLGRLRQWRATGSGLREIGGALRGSSEVLERFREELEQRQRRERVSLGKVHSEAVRGIERKEGEAYRSGLEGSQERAWAAADGRTVYYNPSIDGYRLSRLVWEERMEQARELYGEGAYERMKQAEERASRPMLPSKYPSREAQERSRLERDYGPSR